MRRLKAKGGMRTKTSEERASLIADDAALAKINDVFTRAQSLVDEKVAIAEQLAGDLASFVHRLDGDRGKVAS